MDALRMKKISAPRMQLNVDTFSNFTPETSMNNEHTMTNDQIEDIDAISSIMEIQDSIIIPSKVLTDKPKGRPITQLFESFNATKNAPVEMETTAESSIFDAQNSFTAVTSCFDDPIKAKKIEWNFKEQSEQQKLLGPLKGLVENRIKPKEKEIVTTKPSISDIWLLFEDSVVTSTTRKPNIVKKTIKFPHEKTQEVLKLEKLRQTTLGIPSTKSTLKKRKTKAKLKKKVQLEISFLPQAKTNLLPSESTITLHFQDRENTTHNREIQVAQTDSLESSQQNTRFDDAETGPPLMKYTKRLLEKRATKLEQKAIDLKKISSDHSLQKANIELGSDIEKDFDTSNQQVLESEKSIKNPNQESRSEYEPEPVIEQKTDLLGNNKRKAVAVGSSFTKKSKKGKSSKKSSSKKWKDEKLEEEVNRVERVDLCGQEIVEDTPVRYKPKTSKLKIDPEVKTSNSQDHQESNKRLSIVQLTFPSENNFHNQIHKGLNLISESLMNRMKLVEYEISRKELKLKNELDTKFKELDEFQKKQKETFGTYIENLVSQMTSSEQELQAWIQNNS